MGYSNSREKLQNLLLAVKTASLLTLGPLVAVGNFGSGVVGGLLSCPFSIPFVLCQVCPTPCTFYLVQPWLFSGIVVSSLLMGRVFCGLICPYGLLSSLLYRSPGKKIPVSGVDNKLVYIKYGAAILFLYLAFEAAWISLGLWPVEGLWSFLTVHRGEMVVVIMAVVLILLILSIFIYRPWCRYLCPVGTLLSSSNRFSFLSLERNPNECGICDVCSRTCPLSLQDFDSTDCIRCFSCYASCRRSVLQPMFRGFIRPPKRG